MTKRVLIFLALCLSLAVPSSASIARVGTPACFSSGFTSSLSWSADSGSTGSSRVVFVVANTGGDVVTGVTYNGSALSNVNTQGTLSFWIGLAPSTGSHTVVASLSGDAINACAFFYSGVNQSTTVDSKNKGTGSFATDFSLSTTVVGANSWMVFVTQNSSAGSASAGTGSNAVTGTVDINAFDSNGTVSTGSQTMHATTAGSSNWVGIIASITVPGAGGGSTAVRGTLLGVGP